MFKKLAVFVAAVFTLALGISSASAQETQTHVIDEVVAQVNDDVITLSDIKREMKNAVESLVESGKSKEEAQKLVDEKQGEMIANLINEALILQKAKDLGLDKDVEEQINQRLAQLMKDGGLKTVDQLYAEMEKQGVDPKDLKESWRRQAVRDMVLQKDVQAKIYWQANGTEVKAYYEGHKDKFVKPETVSFDELFLNYAGRDEAQVRTRAKQIYDQLKGGADFDKTVKEQADQPYLAAQTGGKVDKFPVAEIKEDKIAKALTGVKVGDYTLPIDIEQVGMAILKVTGREAKSSESTFDENAVRMAIVQEKAPQAQKDYFAKLRNDSYIKVSESYRPLVSPLLFADERKAASDAKNAKQ
ncbi:MAG: SurA N-terminal domain-containing protein [Acidobacteria bacterium]|nr:SurA N-terminal domain-containing protein [Acidobacteriota bacterium]